MASQVHCRSWHVLDISSSHGTRLQYHVFLMSDSSFSLDVLIYICTTYFYKHKLC